MWEAVKIKGKKMMEMEKEGKDEGKAGWLEGERRRRVRE